MKKRSYINPLTKALAYKQMMEKEDLNQNQLAKKLRISRVRINQLLALLKLPEERQAEILKYGKKQLITERSLRR